MKTFESEIRIRLPYEVDEPSFKIGMKVQASADSPFQGAITGVKLGDRGWSYLIRAGRLECWSDESEVLPVEVGEYIHYLHWGISTKFLDEGYIFHIYDRQNDLESSSLRFYDSPIEALIAARQFLDREFPQTTVVLREVA